MYTNTMTTKMKPCLIASFAISAVIGAPLIAAAQAPASSTPAPRAEAAPPVALPSPDEAGYLIGVNFGAQMHGFGITNEVSVAAIARGVKDGLAGKKTTPADQQRLQTLYKSVVEGQISRNEAAAEKYLAHNAKEKGVKTTSSGLQYKIVSAGNTKAASPVPTDMVTVQYRGRLIDGTEFDSSYKRGTPASFPVNAVIKGWQEALVLMKPGAKWELFVPPELAYGTSPRPGIPPNSLLIFDVDLLSVKPQPTPVTPPATKD